MGNYIDTCFPGQQAQEELQGEMEAIKTYPHMQRPEADEEEEEVRDGVVINRGNSSKEVSEIGKGDEGSVRVKIVLTKEELQWLMMQLKSDGEKRLENMLEEIERERKKGKNCMGWKPSLESIVETPELLEMNRSMRL